MASSNAKAEHVAVVLEAFAENFLVNVPAVHDGKGGYFIEFNVLSNYLLNAPISQHQEIADYINEGREPDLVVAEG